MEKKRMFAKQAMSPLTPDAVEWDYPRSLASSP
jgi:hypothetical protein